MMTHLHYKQKKLKHSSPINVHICKSSYGNNFKIFWQHIHVGFSYTFKTCWIWQIWWLSASYKCGTKLAAGENTQLQETHLVQFFFTAANKI